MQSEECLVREFARAFLSKISPTTTAGQTKMELVRGSPLTELPQWPQEATFGCGPTTTEEKESTWPTISPKEKITA